MEKVVGVYETPEEAREAEQNLIASGFDTKNVRVYNRDDLRNKYIHLKLNLRMEKTEIALIMITTTTLGILTGLRYFIIPGFHSIFGGGIVVGAMVGFGVGIIISAIVS